MPADADEARRVAEQVLSGPEYREAATPWWQEVLERIDRALSSLLGSLGGSGGSPAVAWVVVILVVGVAAVVVALAVRSLLRSRRRRGATEGDDATSTRRRHRAPLEGFDGDAAALEAEGRWREGMRARYRDLVVRLTDRAVLDPAASRTTGEHRRELRTAAPTAASEFDAAAELFDRAWYGNRPTGPDEAERFARLAERVEEHVGEGAR